MKKYAKWYDDGYPDTWHVHFDDNLYKDVSCYYFTSCPIFSYMNFIGLSETMKPTV